MSSKRRIYVGIDVHTKEHKVAIVSADLLKSPGMTWKQVKPLSIKNDAEDFQRLETAIRSYASDTNNVTVAIDHTGGHYSEPLVYFLQNLGYKVYYLEPRAVKAAKERLLDEESKSDVIDANSFAYLLYLRDVHGLSFRISAVTPELTSKAAALNSLTLQRWQINKLIGQATNRLHQLLLAVFPEAESQYFEQLLKITPLYPTPKAILASNGLEAVTGLSVKVKQDILQLAADTVGIPGEMYQWLIRELSVQRMELAIKRDAVTEILRKEVRAHPYGRILLSFPYFGEVITATIIGVIKNMDRWPNKKKCKKALGVYSSLRQSGTSMGRTRQGKEGSRHGRRVLFQACLGCIRTHVPDNDFKDYYARQVSQGKPKMKALVSTMGKLAEIVYHCLKVGEPYQYQGTYRVTISSGDKKS